MIPCECGGDGIISGNKYLKDGTHKKRIKCRDCGKHWLIVIEEVPVIEHWGLWLGVNGVWYSPRDQERIREICKSIL